MPNPLSKLLGARGSGRNLLMLIDTATTALTSVIIVIGASRSLRPAGLDSFSLAQLVLVMLVGNLRTTIWSPALAAQRSTGKAVIPRRWVAWLAPTVGACVGIPACFLIPAHGIPRLEWFLTLAGASTVLLAQDGMRSVLMSRELMKGALASDVIALVVVAGGTVGQLLPHTAQGLLLYWAAATGLALVVAIVLSWRYRDSTDLPAQSLAETWRIGRWGAVDATFASIATLLPFFVATLYVANASTGPYRVLQTALGPLNIIYTTVVTAFTLDSWQSAGRKGLRQLKGKALRLTRMLGVFVLAYVGLGLPAMVFVSGVRHPDLLRICIIVGLSGIMGTVGAPVNAAALSLGYQRFGAIIRFLVFLIALGCSLPWTVNHLVPWHDPIGTSMLLSSSVTMLGWMVGFSVAYIRELRRPARALIEP